MEIFHSYLSLPEGIFFADSDMNVAMLKYPVASQPSFASQTNNQLNGAFAKRKMAWFFGCGFTSSGRNLIYKTPPKRFQISVISVFVGVFNVRGTG
jgi:hypothetical protein